MFRDPSEEIIAALEAHRRRGVTIEQACSLEHISTRTFYEWKKRALAGENGAISEFRDRVLSRNKRGGVAPITSANPDWRRIDVFEDWGRKLVLDSGECWEPESWQLAPVADLLSDLYEAVWLVVPEGNGKTTLIAALVLYLLENQLTPEIPIGSATVTQADTLFRQIEGFIVRSGKLVDFNLAPGVKRIDCRATHGHTRVYPHNERSGDGVIPSAAALDELHLHPNMRLYQLWKGKYRKRRGPLMVISTAGEPDSDFENLRGKLIKDAVEREENGAYIRAVSRERGGTVLHDWGVRDRTQAFDMEVVAAANPLKLITAELLQDKYDEPEMTDEHWLRRTCNIASHAEGQAIRPEEWDRLKGSLDYVETAVQKYGFIDLGWKVDTSGIGVFAWESHDRRLILAAEALEPPVEESQVVATVLRLQLEYDVKAWVADPHAGAEQMIQLLEKGQHPLQTNDELRAVYDLPPIELELDPPKFDFIAHSQDNAPMTQAAVRLDEAIRNGWLVHDGNQMMRKHALKAVKTSVGPEKWKYDRPPNAKNDRDLRKKFPIDLLTGLLMANNIAVEESEKLTPLVGWS